MDKQEFQLKKAKALEGLALYKAKEKVNVFIPLEKAQMITRPVTAYLDGGTVKCRVNLPACYVNKKVKVIVMPD